MYIYYMETWTLREFFKLAETAFGWCPVRNSDMGLVWGRGGAYAKTLHDGYVMILRGVPATVGDLRLDAWDCGALPKNPLS